jgi:signal transduction histidine kinase
MCGKTLLDTFDNLLSFTKINSGCTSTGHQPVSVPSSQSETCRNGIGANSPIDLSMLVEEVIDTAFAGNEFIKTTAMKGRSATGGTIHFQSASACSSSGLEAITVLIDYDITKDWLFDAQAGVWTRIILNLVGNSLKYTQRGRVTVRLDSRPLPYLDSKNNVEIMLTVTDEGRGMSVDFMSQDVFTPFAQEDFMSPGTGLDLSVIKSIVTSMGGTISVKSEKSQGTEFAVVVRMKRAELAAKPARLSPVSTIANMLQKQAS